MSLPKPYYEDEARGIVIYCGDCRDILPHLPKVDLLLTDPPYGIADKMQGGTWGKQYGDVYKQWDATPADPKAFIELAQASVIWGGNYLELPASRGWLIWDKTLRGMTFADCELCWTNADMNSRVFSYMQPNGFLKQERHHPTEKPLALMRWCLGFFPKAETVLDPFMGSGTTLVACKQLGRKCIGIELEEKYCEIAVRRLAQDNLFEAEELARIGS